MLVLLILTKKNTHSRACISLYISKIAIVRALALENSNATLFYNSKKPLLSLYRSILQYLYVPNFYFPFLLIKIIYLHNEIMIPCAVRAIGALFS